MKNNIENTASTAIASASSSPFKTAFKVVIGIAAAQLLLTVVLFGGLALVVTTLFYVLK